MVESRTGARQATVLLAVLALIATLIGPAAAQSVDTADEVGTAEDEGACPSGVVPSSGFADAADSGGAHPASIDCLLWYGVTEGQTATSFGTTNNVQRAQLATFLVRVMEDVEGLALPAP